MNNVLDMVKETYLKYSSVSQVQLTCDLSLPAVQVCRLTVVPPFPPATSSTSAAAASATPPTKRGWRLVLFLHQDVTAIKGLKNIYCKNQCTLLKKNHQNQITKSPSNGRQWLRESFGEGGKLVVFVLWCPQIPLIHQAYDSYFNQPASSSVSATSPPPTQTHHLAQNN